MCWSKYNNLKENEKSVIKSKQKDLQEVEERSQFGYNTTVSFLENPALQKNCLWYNREDRPSSLP